MRLEILPDPQISGRSKKTFRKFRAKRSIFRVFRRVKRLIAGQQADRPPPRKIRPARSEPTLPWCVATSYLFEFNPDIRRNPRPRSLAWSRAAAPKVLPISPRLPPAIAIPRGGLESILFSTMDLVVMHQDREAQPTLTSSQPDQNRLAVFLGAARDSSSRGSLRKHF